MASGLKTLHQIDAAIKRARQAVSEVSELPKQSREALIDLRREQAALYDQIADTRLGHLRASGPEAETLGYIDRQAEALLLQHREAEQETGTRVNAKQREIEKLEADRRAQEKAVAKAVDAYDKAVAATEARLLKDPGYITLTDNVAEAESMVERAEQKLELAQVDEKSKGEPFRKDELFNYLAKREYGTKDAKGWALTKALDGWVAGRINYRDQALTYRRLTEIPQRLARHISRLEDGVISAQNKLQNYESDALIKDGVTAKQQASTDAQARLDALDEQIDKLEAEHQILLSEQSQLSNGEAGPYREAISLLASTLQKKDLPSLKRLAAQTRSRADDQAIRDLRSYSKKFSELEDDYKDAGRLLKKYQRTLKELETVRRRFKNSRYDAPSSVFGQSDLLSALLGQVLRGALSGDDFWRQIARAQRTVRRYGDQDFGGIDWEGGFRIPRQRGGGVFGGTTRGGGWGGRESKRQRRRTSLPRRPRQSLPRMPRGGGFGGGGRKSGGFKTGGRF